MDTTPYIESCIYNLAEFTDKHNPYTRLVFSEEYKAARKWLSAEFERLGCKVFRDHAGNLKGVLASESKFAKRVIIGSHLDTVFCGGRFDGIAGVVAGLAVLKSLNDNLVKLPFDIEIYDFLGEELNEWNTSCIGTRGLTGKLNSDVLHRKNTKGELLIDKISNEGGNPDLLLRNETDTENVLASFELHIEQGSQLQNTKTHLGIVNSIPSISRHMISIDGEAGHSGTIQMKDRSDALVAAAELIVVVSNKAKSIASHDKKHFVATIGYLKLQPNAATIIPSQVNMLMDLRAEDADKRDQFLNFVKLKSSEIQDKVQVSISIEEKAFTSGVLMNSNLNLLLKEVTSSLGFSSTDMASGAGHDAGHIAKVAPACLIFVPCLDGRSHCPEEFARAEDISRGAVAIEEAVTRLARLNTV